MTEQRITATTRVFIGPEDLDERYAYTRISCQLTLEQSEGDVGYGRSNFFEIETDEVGQKDVYIGQILCESVAIRKKSTMPDPEHLNPKNTTWILDVVVHNIINKEHSSSIVNDYCCIMSCELIRKSYNLAYGVPKFSFLPMSLNIAYGTNADTFDMPYSQPEAHLSIKSVSTIPHDFSLPCNAVDINEHKYFLDSILRRDFGAKYLSFFLLLEKLFESTRSDESIERSRQSRAQRIYEKLRERGITEIDTNGHKTMISVELLKDLVEKRDAIAHHGGSIRDISSLYDKLFPIALKLLPENTR